MVFVIQRLLCATGRHRRDRHAAWFDGNVWHSTCVGCGQPMYRDFDGWHLGAEAPPATPPQS